MQSWKILLLTPQSSSLAKLKSMLVDENIRVEHAECRESSIAQISTAPPHMIVLECAEQGVVDLLYCQKIRYLYKGLLVLLSDLDKANFQIFALNLGVDASFSRSTDVVLIRANLLSLLRRFMPPTPVGQLEFDGLVLDLNRRDAIVGDSAVNLSTVEFDIFYHLVQKPGCVVSRDEIHRKVYKAEYNGYDRSIDLYISRIRQKIGDSLSSPIFLKTVRGAGYQFIGTAHSD
ncbi:response regulator transcription factor [Desulfopila aestuarii]|nr:response regulator transcription factor [Desulfopila aestuarii]